HRRFSVLGSQFQGSTSSTENWQLRAGFLAGPLGFEPRQSAPKALDLPLVDGPVPIVDLLVDCTPEGPFHCQSSTRNQQSKTLRRRTRYQTMGQRASRRHAKAKPSALGTKRYGSTTIRRQ